MPEVGFKLQDDSGRVCSDAELAWPDQQVAVVLPDRLDAVEVSREQGWTVLVADEVSEDQLLDLLSESSPMPTVALAGEFFDAYARLPRVQQKEVR